MLANTPGLRQRHRFEKLPEPKTDPSPDRSTSPPPISARHGLQLGGEARQDEISSISQRIKYALMPQQSTARKQPLRPRAASSATDRTTPSPVATATGVGPGMAL